MTASWSKPVRPADPSAHRHDLDLRTIVGGWRLVHFVRHGIGGRTEDVFGPDPEGLLCYTQDGWMSVVLCSKGRIDRFESEEFLGGSAAEKAAAYQSYCSYAGRYRVDGHQIIHILELSLFPNWKGSTQPRRCHFDDECLVLESQPIFADGQTWIYEARWRRAIEG